MELVHETWLVLVLTLLILAATLLALVLSVLIFAAICFSCNADSRIFCQSTILQFNMTVCGRMNKVLHLKTTLSQLSPTSHQVNLRSVQHLFLTCISAIPWSCPLFLISSIRPVVTMDGTVRTAHSYVFRPPPISSLTLQIFPSTFLLINQPDALIIQIYSIIKLYMFRASSVPIIRSFLLYIRHW